MPMLIGKAAVRMPGINTEPPLPAPAEPPPGHEDADETDDKNTHEFTDPSGGVALPSGVKECKTMLLFYIYSRFSVLSIGMV